MGMTNEVSTFTTPADIGAFEFRVTSREGNPWFVHNDVCRVLEIGNPSQALSRLDDDEKSALILNPASFFEKKQAIDNATKVAIFGTLYWTHLRLGRLNGPKFYC